jgi:hypothetical protein
VLQTGAYTLIKRMTRGGTVTLTLTGADGQKVKEPAALVRSWLSDCAPDPLRFAEMTDAEQARILAAAAGITEDLAKADEVYAEAYTERALVNKSAKAAVAAASLHQLPDGPDVEVSATELMSQYEKAVNENAVREKAQAWKKGQAANIERLGSQIADLQGKIAALRQNIEHLAGEKVKQQALLDEKIPTIDAMPVHDTDALKSSLSTVEAQNNLARKRAEIRQVQEMAKQAQERADAAERAVQDAHEARANIISTAKFPIDGVKVADGVLTVAGRRVQEMSTAEKIKIGVRVALAQKPAMRLVLIDRGESLDNESVQVLIEELERNDAVGIMEVVDADAATSNVEIVAVESKGGDGDE